MANNCVNNGSINLLDSSWYPAETGATATQLSYAALTQLTVATVAAGNVLYCTGFTITASDVIAGMVLRGIKGTSSANTITAALYDLTGTITGATNANPIVITSAAHGLSTNDWVSITAVGGNTHANTTVQVTYVDAARFSLNSIAGNAAYTSGGVWHRICNGTSGPCTVTINETDLSTLPSWQYFCFNGNNYTGTGLATHRIGIRTTATTGMASFARDATQANWTRLLPVVSAYQPTTTDNIYVVGQLTAPATLTPATVTMNSTTSGTLTYGAVDVGLGGTLNYGTAASTDYMLVLGGSMNVWNGGVLNMGTLGNAMPAGSSAQTIFNCSTNVQWGLIVNDGGTFNGYGNPLGYVSTMLSADAAQGATSLTTADSTGWLQNDILAIASTSPTPTECESWTVAAGGASGTTIPLNGTGLAKSHYGTAPYAAEVGNVARNVKISGASSGLQSYVYLTAASTTALNYVELYYMGSATANKLGITSIVSTGSCSITYCALHDFVVTDSIGFYSSSATANNITFSYNVLYNIDQYHVYIIATPNILVVNNNLAIKNNNAYNYSHLMVFYDAGSTYQYNTAVGSKNGSGIYIGEGTSTGSTVGLLGTCTNNTAHSNAADGVLHTGTIGGTLQSTTAWCNGRSGLDVTACNTAFNTATLFSNGTTVAGYGNLNICGSNCYYQSISDQAGSHYAAPLGVTFMGPGPDAATDNVFETSVFGYLQTHATADIGCPSTEPNYVTAKFAYSNIFNSTNTITGQASGLLAGSEIRSGSYYSGSTTTGSQTVWKQGGTCINDALIYRSSIPSERLTPLSASIKLPSARKLVRVNNGANITVSVYVRLSSSGDGARYNGNMARLMKSNQYGTPTWVGSDVSLVSTSAAYGTWQLLSYAVPSGYWSTNTWAEFYIDCDGTAGWVNVDWANDSGETHWLFGSPWAALLGGTAAAGVC